MTVQIIATIGPASKNKSTLTKMSKIGMNIARLNTKYGSESEYDNIIKNLKNTKCKILFDIKGTKELVWIKKKKFDYLAVSFAESAKQIEEIRKQVSRKVKVISKIETKKGIDNIDELIKSSDGIMVARGDLGKNTRLVMIPIRQKVIIKQCLENKKFVVTATEMLLSMTKNKIPTRSEVSDVANAVLDGSSAVMLSEETAIGLHPIEVVRLMREIINATNENKRLLLK